jgi:hypothetical protein
MLRVMSDTMIYDLIVSTPALADRMRALIASRDLDHIQTHVQRDQLAAIPDEKKRVAVLEVPARSIPTTDLVLDVSPLGEARLGTGSAGGIGYEDIGHRHAHDALIAMAAAADADVLVTHDVRLTKKVRSSQAALDVWDFERFHGWIESAGS